MRIPVILLLLAGAAFAADTPDPWTKVKELKSGTEIRVYKKGTAVPLLAKSGDATDDKLIVIVKNAETAIAKNDIERVDARPSGKRPVTKNSTSTTNEITMQPRSSNDPIPVPAQSNTYSSGMSIGSKPDFETVYRRAR